MCNIEDENMGLNDTYVKTIKTRYHNFDPGSNPTIVSVYASAVKNYVTNSLHFEKKSFYFWKKL
jgi:hypothetical protein